MRLNILLILLALLVGAPLFAQESDKPEKTESAEEVDEGESEDEKEEPEKPRREMTEEGKSLFEDCERCYAKYYEIVLKKFKANESYKAEDVWNEAVKEAENAEYKDGDAFHKAIEAMQRKDRVFKKKLRDLMVKKAKENAKAIEEWTNENED